MDFCHSREIYQSNLENSYWILLLATGKFIGNKFADKIVKPKLLTPENSTNFDEIVIPLEKR